MDMQYLKLQTCHWPNNNIFLLKINFLVPVKSVYISTFFIPDTMEKSKIYKISSIKNEFARWNLNLNHENIISDDVKVIDMIKVNDMILNGNFNDVAKYLSSTTLGSLSMKEYKYKTNFYIPILYYVSDDTLGKLSLLQKNVIEYDGRTDTNSIIHIILLSFMRNKLLNYTKKCRTCKDSTKYNRYYSKISFIDW